MQSTPGRGTETQLGMVIGGSSQGRRRSFGPIARPLAISIVCLSAMAACSSSLPPIPSSALSSADTSEPAISTSSASDPVASGSPPPSALTFGSFNACALLPPQALTKIVGGKINPAAMPVGDWIAGQCAWSSPKSGFFLTVGTAVSMREGSDPLAPDAKAKLAEFRDRARAAGGTRTIKGIGDEAVLATNGMAAYAGDAYLEVTRLNLTDNRLIKIMKLALRNLGL